MNHTKFLFECIEYRDPVEAEKYLNSLKEEDPTAAVQFSIDAHQLHEWARDYGDVSLQEDAWYMMQATENYGPVQLPRLISLLSIAAWKGSLEMVDLLLRHGADINASSVDEEYQFGTINLFYPPIIVACARRETAIAKLLLERRAYVKSHRGANCLATCFDNEELVRLLVAHGTDVNIEIWIGFGFGNWGTHLPLLQYALRYEDLNVIRLLLDVGADPRMRSRCSDEDALQFACRRRRQKAVDLLLGAIGLGLKEKIDAYRLIGASWMNGQIGDDVVNDEHDVRSNDVTKATSYWIKAMKLLCAAQPAISSVSNHTSVPLEAFGIAQEPGTVAELKELLSRPDGADMYAMLLRAQILGPYDFLSMKIMKYIVGRQTDGIEYDRAIDLYNYFLHYLTTDDPNQYNFCDIRGSLNSWCHCGEHKSRGMRRTILTDFRNTHSLVGETYVEPEVVQGWVEAGLVLLDKLVMKITTLAPAVEYSCYEMIDCKRYAEQPTYDWRKRAYFMRCYSKISYSLQILDVILTLNMNKDCKDRLRRITVELIRSCSGSRATGPLLSYGARDRRTVSLDVFQYLLQCSDDLSLRDVRCGLNQALCALADELQELSAVHKHIKPVDKTRFESEIKSYALLLMNSGAHADAKNSRGERLSTVFRQRFHDFDPFPYETLKCLAARVVSRLADPLLQEKVPQTIVDFVRMH